MCSFFVLNSFNTRTTTNAALDTKTTRDPNIDIIAGIPFDVIADRPTPAEKNNAPKTTPARE